MKRLPEKLSDLIELALRDLRKVEADERYMVDMGNWHTPDPEYDNCRVCFAGAVMAETLEMPIDKELVPRDAVFDGYTRTQLEALDVVRTGDIDGALKYLGHLGHLGREDILFSSDVENVTPYSRNREEFHSTMKDIAVKLRIVGY